MYHAGVPFEVMLASYYQKRGSKEIPHVNQEPEQQKKIDEAKLAEWHVIEGKHAGRLVLGEEAQAVRQKLAHRIMDSRYVVTLKQEERLSHTSQSQMVPFWDTAILICRPKLLKAPCKARQSPR